MVQTKIKLGYTKNQKEIFFNTKERFITIAKGRRFGFTRGAAQFIIECLLEGKFCLWVDTVQGNLQNYFEKYFLPILNQLPNIWNWQKDAKTLKIGNGALHMRSAERPENIEGLGYDVIILNEAGIILKDAYLWDNAISPMLLDSKTSRAIIGGVPKGKNRFYDLARRGETGQEGWKHFVFSSYDNPFISKTEIDRLIDELGGVQNDVVKQEIFGEFLDTTSNLLFSMKLIDDAMARVQSDDSGAVIWGLDVARYGDDRSVLVVREGNYVKKIESFNKLSLSALRAEIYQRYLNTEAKPDVIFVDAIGVGAGVCDELQHYIGGGIVREAIGSAKANDRRYENKRAEMYFNLEKALKYLKITPHEQLKQDLAMLSYKFSSAGKYIISSKDEIKKVYGRSPDFADALAMTYYDIVLKAKDDDWSGDGW